MPKLGLPASLTGLLVPFLTVVAFAVSYNRRREKNYLIRVMLAFFALALLAVFFREALSSLYDTRCRSRGSSCGCRSYTPSTCPLEKTSRTRC